MNVSEQRESNRELLLIIDSYALLFRGFYATWSAGKLMRNSKGLYTNGLYQFTRIMLDAIRKFQPTHVVCAFDMGKDTFRKQLYPPYKAHREEPPLELIPQFDKLWELVEAFDIPCLGKEGFEADDVMGSIAKTYANQKTHVRILTGDGDALQLIDENTEVILMKKGFGHYEVIGLHNLYETRGLRHPGQVVEMKALMGDTADNIPGCPNIGPKTALKLLEQFGTVDQIYGNIESLKGKVKENLIQFKEQVYLSRQLASIRTDVEISCPLEECRFGWNPDKLIPVLEELEFRSIIRTIA